MKIINTKIFNRSLTFVILSTVLFCLMTVLTASIERPADGNDEYGFPMRYFYHYGGLCEPLPECAGTSFYISHLLVDIGFAGLLAFGLMWLGVKIKKFVNYDQINRP